MPDKKAQLLLQKDLLFNILKHSDDIGKCAAQITMQIRELVGVSIVALVEYMVDGSFSIAGVCPERKRLLLESPDAKSLILSCCSMEDAQFITEGRSGIGELLSAMNIADSFIIPLRDNDRPLGSILLLGSIDFHNASEILEGLKSVSGVLSLILKNSFLYRNMENLVQEKMKQYISLQESLAEQQKLLAETERIGRIGGWTYNRLTGEQHWTDEIFSILETDKEKAGTASHPILDYLTPEFVHTAREALYNAVHNGQPYDQEWQVTTAAGNRRWLHAAAQAEKVNGIPVKITGYFQDITEHKDAQEAHKANKAKNTFISNMSHELRTPLNSVITLAGVLNRRLAGKIPSEEYRYLEIIERNGKNLLSLINDILDLSRIEAGRAPLNISEFRLETIIRELIEMIRPQAQLKNIFLEYFIEDNVPPIVADADKCRHILQNLIGNAVKFTDAGGVTVIVSRSSTGVDVLVSDTGIGIAPDFMPHLFEEFKQADDSISRRHGGTGLGLAIAKKNAELLHSTITVESTPGEGSSFTLHIPLNNMTGEFAV